MSSNKDKKDTNSSEEEIVRTEPETDTLAVNLDKNGDADISIEDTVENQKKEI